MTALAWFWQHHSVHVDECDDLEEAIALLTSFVESGTAAVECIETWDENGERTVLDHRAVHDIINERARIADAAEPPAAPVVARLCVLPDPEWPDVRGRRVLHSFTDADAAQSERERLLPLLGARLVIERVPS